MQKTKKIVTQDGETVNVLVKRKWYQMKRTWIVAVVLVAIIAGTSGGGETAPTGTGNQEVTQNAGLTLGDTFTFDGSSGKMEITIGTGIEWFTVDNEYSDNYGDTVFRIPITVHNVGDETGGLNMFDFNFYGTNGTRLNDISFYFDDSVSEAGDMRAGATQESFMYILFDGDGEYVIEFEAGFGFGDKAEVVFNVQQ